MLKYRLIPFLDKHVNTNLEIASIVIRFRYFLHKIFHKSFETLYRLRDWGGWYKETLSHNQSCERCGFEIHLNAKQISLIGIFSHTRCLRCGHIKVVVV